MTFARGASSGNVAVSSDGRLGDEGLENRRLGVEDVGAGAGYPSAAPALVTTSDVSGVTGYGVFSSLTTVNVAASSHQS
jgi:hypothetical protein